MPLTKKQATLYTDGGARGNPGPAGIGVVLLIDGEEAVTHAEYIGSTTNNQAEYKALVEGLKQAKEKGVTDIVCFLDSELVVKQLNGQYRVKHADLKPLAAHIAKETQSFGSVSFRHVPRAKNKKADKLVNLAIDKKILR